jgi:L-2-hydroxyglutarate oxidase LhgO
MSAWTGPVSCASDQTWSPCRRREDYSVDADRRADFYAEAVRFLPFLEEEELTPSMAGIRPKLAAHAFVDFAVRREKGDQAGLINLIGIDSPGLTSGPALAEHVGALLAD